MRSTQTIKFKNSTEFKLTNGSLGHTYATYINTSGFDPVFYRSMSIAANSRYLACSDGFLHGCTWRVLGLKAFELAQARRTIAGILIAGGFS